MYQYQHVAIGGTFDHFHLGHKSLMDLAFNTGTKVLIGITSDSFIQDKSLSIAIEPYLKRKQSVENYLKNKNYLTRSSIFKIEDIYGIALSNQTIDAIVVTKQTQINALKINNQRKKRGLTPLKIIIAPYIKTDDNKIISSKRIRLGQIDRDGNTYINIFPGKKQLILPEYLRARLRKPMGNVISFSRSDLKDTAEKAKEVILQSRPTLTISIGDIVTSSLVEIGLTPDIQIIDFKSRQKRIKSALPNLPFVQTEKHINRPGTLRRSIADSYLKLVYGYLRKGEKQRMIIIGEEDLVALVAILLSPLYSIVLYGQYDLGVIMVTVTEQIKDQIKNIIKLFD